MLARCARATVISTTALLCSPQCRHETVYLTHLDHDFTILTPVPVHHISDELTVHSILAIYIHSTLTPGAVFP